MCVLVGHTDELLRPDVWGTCIAILFRWGLQLAKQWRFACCAPPPVLSRAPLWGGCGVCVCARACVCVCVCVLF